MKTLEMLSVGPKVIPTATAWYLGDLGEARGRQELFIRQSPQRLKVLREHAIIESAISSNRLEGVEMDKKRINAVILKNSRIKDRSEEEIRGYRDALNLIHGNYKKMTVNEAQIKKIHRISRGEVWDAGKYKGKPVDIIEKYPDGSQEVRFKTVSPGETPEYMKKLIEMGNRGFKEQLVPPLITLAAFNLDFLCIHPFRDGNGRVSRLLLLLQCYQAGYDVGRYISIESIIEQNKERYYETLKQSSYNWHKGRHDHWFYTNFLLYILKTAYKEFEKRLESLSSPKGMKTNLIADMIDKTAGTFSVSDIQRECPGVSIDLIRSVLKNLRKNKKIECLSRGINARWQKRDKR